MMLCIIPASALGAKRVREVPEENFAYIEEDDEYWAKFIPYNPEYIHVLIAGKKLRDYSIGGYLKYGKKIVSNKVEWLNPQQIIVIGNQTVQILSEHEGKQIILIGEIYCDTIEEVIEATTIPSLTASTVLLDTKAIYKISENTRDFSHGINRHY